MSHGCFQLRRCGGRFGCGVLEGVEEGGLEGVVAHSFVFVFCFLFFFFAEGVFFYN